MNHKSASTFIFVYGTLRKGMGGYDLLSGSRFLGKATTQDLYAMYVGEFPYVTKQEQISTVVGEVYEVTAEMLMLLDEFEGHPDVYTRELIEVMMEDGSSAKAWIYFYNNPRGTVIESGDFKDYLC